MKEIIYKGIIFTDPDFDQPTRHRAMTAYAIKTGIIERKPCEVCKNTYKIRAHHEMYSDYLNVRWLCSSCHSKIHYMFNMLMWAENGIKYELSEALKYPENAYSVQIAKDYLDRLMKRYNASEHGVKKTKAQYIIELAQLALHQKQVDREN